jgi:hypothetical protein
MFSTIVTTCAATTGVVTAEKCARGPTEVPMTQRPYVGVEFEPAASPDERYCGNQARSYLLFKLHVYVEGTSDAARITALLDLHHALRAALEADQGLGGVACGVWVDAYEASNVSDRTQRDGAAIAPVRVRFHESAL